MLDSQSEAGDALARVCVEKLSGFLSDEDQNRESAAVVLFLLVLLAECHISP